MALDRCQVTVKAGARRASGVNGGVFPSDGPARAAYLAGMEQLATNERDAQGPELKVAMRELDLPGLHAPAGHLISGSRRGPTLLVVGHGAVIEPAYRRILDLPSLPWIRGDLVLARFDDARPGLDDTILDGLDRRLGPFDDVLHLIGQASDAQALYWTILRFCAQYGMISGRGVPEWHPGLHVVR